MHEQARVRGAVSCASAILNVGCLIRVEKVAQIPTELINVFLGHNQDIMSLIMQRRTMLYVVRDIILLATAKDQVSYSELGPAHAVSHFVSLCV